MSDGIVTMLYTTPRDTASKWISAAKVLVTIYTILSIIGGIIVANVSQINEYTGDTEHPLVGIGLGIILVALTIGTVVMAVLAYLAWRVDEAKPQHKSSIPTPVGQGAWG